MRARSNIQGINFVGAVTRARGRVTAEEAPIFETKIGISGMMGTRGEQKKDQITSNTDDLTVSAQGEAAAEDKELLSVEKVFSSKEVPPWQKQLTLRAFVVSFVLGVLFTFIVMKLNLTTGIIPSLNVSAGLLGFFFVKTWTKLLEKSGMLRQPFTRQENTVIQTCVVASSGIAFSGGF
ncbi:hypothetical protein F2P56_009041, partial [Juglans regia]